AAHESDPLALRDALPISRVRCRPAPGPGPIFSIRLTKEWNVARKPLTGARPRWYVHRTDRSRGTCTRKWAPWFLDVHSSDSTPRSEEHTSELQSRENLVC